MKHLAVIAVLLAASPALADDKADKADKLFKKGKKLLGEKKYADACPAFEQSDKLDPGIGAKLNIAKCYEDWGRLATAYRWYEDASELAATSKDNRSVKIKALMTELDGSVPRLTIKVPEGADPTVLATLTLDDKPLGASELNTEMRVDPGPHAIEFRSEGKKRKKMAPVERGGESEVTLDIPKGEGTTEPVASTKPDSSDKPDAFAAKPPAQPSPPGRGQRIAGITVAGAGVVAVGIAGIITLGARSTYKDALADNCMGSTSMCNMQGLSDTKDARHTANIATVVTLIGAAAVIGGVVLYVTAPAKAGKNRRAREKSSENDAMYLSPVLDRSGGGIVLGGAF